MKKCDIKSSKHLYRNQTKILNKKLLIKDEYFYLKMRQSKIK